VLSDPTFNVSVYKLFTALDKISQANMTIDRALVEGYQYTIVI